MRIIKLFFVFVAFSAATFYSCSDSSPIDNETNASQKSVSLRTTIFELVKANPPGNRPANSATKASRLTPVNPFCFEFVYPIVMSYNNGTAVTIASSEGLWQIINNESPALFLDGVVFPFEIVQNNTSQTINSESEFAALIDNCGFNNLYDEIHSTYCFDIIFPINLAYNGQVVTINSEEELLIFGDAPGFNGQIQVVFPISVHFENQTVVINSIYEFYQMAINCTNDCICTQEYAPVCVQTNNGIMEFGNMCYAICAGYSQSDLVPCNPVQTCNISNLTAVPGECDPMTNSYSVTINFSVSDTSATQFEVSNGGIGPIGTYAIASLPITIDNFPASVLGAPNLNMVIITIAGNNDSCTATQSFTIPTCSGGCNCPTDYNPVCVYSGGAIVTYTNACLAQCDGFTPNDFVSCGTPSINFMSQLGTCYHIFYPVTVQYQGALVTVNSDAELVQYYNPVTQTMPIMNYPIAVSWGLQAATFTYSNQAAFEAAILSANCP